MLADVADAGIQKAGIQTAGIEKTGVLLQAAPLAAPEPRPDVLLIDEDGSLARGVGVAVLLA
ncbi:MAG: hypothetical protein B7Z80_22830, partial [Rhodospirillales bacterium 20-64-7]